MILTAKRETGNIGEEAACTYLIRKGFKIIERNYLKQYGEIDIIAVYGDTVRFIEVKSISRENNGRVAREKEGYRPEEQVHPKKLQRIAKTAETYMASTNDTRDYQIDVVGVYLDFKRRIASCRLYEQVL